MSHRRLNTTETRHHGAENVSETNEPPYDKTNKMTVRPAKTQISLGIHPVWSDPSLIRVFAARTKKHWVLSYPLSAQRRLWSDWTDAQSDLSLRWAHTHFVGFVMRRLKCPDNMPLCLNYTVHVVRVDMVHVTRHSFNLVGVCLACLPSGLIKFWRVNHCWGRHSSGIPFVPRHGS